MLADFAFGALIGVAAGVFILLAILFVAFGNWTNSGSH